MKPSSIENQTVAAACRSKPPLGGTKRQEKDNAKSG
jgi:hypothetical protein